MARRIDWARGRQMYITSLRVTLEEVATEIGAHHSTVRAKAAKEGWNTTRRQAHQQLVQDGLKKAMEEKGEGAAALVHIEYQEGLACVAKLQAKRVADGDAWGADQILKHLRAFEAATRMMRLSLGLPTEITSSPEDARSSYEAAIQEARARAADAPPQT